MLDFGQFFDIMIFAVEHNDTQQYRSGHNEHDWKSCVRQKRTESSNLSCCARKSTTQQGGAFLFESEIRTGCERSEKTALVGAVMVAGMLTDGQGTGRYAREILLGFRERCGATICKDLKGVETGKVLSISFIVCLFDAL